eukprot:1448311-Rhodomonas_salina.4
MPVTDFKPPASYDARDRREGTIPCAAYNVLNQVRMPVTEGKGGGGADWAAPGTVLCSMVLPWLCCVVLTAVLDAAAGTRARAAAATRLQLLAPCLVASAARPRSGHTLSLSRARAHTRNQTRHSTVPVQSVPKMLGMLSTKLVGVFRSVHGAWTTVLSVCCHAKLDGVWLEQLSAVMLRSLGSCCT